MASRLGDTIFALVHLGLLLAIVVYAAVLLFRGEFARGGLIFAVLAVYYVLILHKAVRREIARKRGSRRT
ncbi:MAG: hypothetical protein FJY80_05970 [Candidatus Aminicenantes bacterium]|nr:hypothetical protein [Candidatus Aminicenantes bacterium]